ncbi:hypothetical protein, partial [Paeniglutamicibacter sp. ZC-3]|uniref:hypothetical protein n=1 Tax=Paeniglutamicibacter sp. ZC-3 TaxID=2986919 RepID=UPI0021F6BFCA
MKLDANHTAAIDRPNDSREAGMRGRRWVKRRFWTGSIETAEMAWNRAEMACFLAPKWPISNRRNT